MYTPKTQSIEGFYKGLKQPRTVTPYRIFIFAGVWHMEVKASDGVRYQPPFEQREFVASYTFRRREDYEKFLQVSFDLRKDAGFKDVAYIVAQEPGKIRRFQFVQLTQELGFPKRRWVACGKFYKGTRSQYEWGTETPYHDWLKANNILPKDKEAALVVKN